MGTVRTTPLHVYMETVPAHKQRYSTCGDWFIRPDNKWYVRATEQADWRHAFLVMVHEMIEMALCVHRGINEQDVTNFDMNFESERLHGHASGEPGDDPRAPYRKEHRFAENMERQVAHELDVVWSAYDAIIEHA